MGNIYFHPSTGERPDVFISLPRVHTPSGQQFALVKIPSRNVKRNKRQAPCLGGETFARLLLWKMVGNVLRRQVELEGVESAPEGERLPRLDINLSTRFQCIWKVSERNKNAMFHSCFQWAALSWGWVCWLQPRSPGRQLSPFKHWGCANLGANLGLGMEPLENFVDTCRILRY